MTKADFKALDDIIGSHLPNGYRDRLIELITRIKVEAYEKGKIQGMKDGTVYPWTS